jgi:CRP/FNR family transcriptional regulator, cyclic AMP receptor protein
MSDQPTPFNPTGLFAGLSADDAEAIGRVGSPITFAEGEVVFSSGDEGDAMYVITDGQAKVNVGGRFHVMKTGDVFGEMALLAPGKRMATVEAVSGLSALRVPAEAFQDFLLDHPRVALSIMKQLVVRLREVEQRIDAWMA